MPLYEYACQKCGHQLEARQKISDDLLKTCPNCGTDSLERLVSRTTFALKGSGWYADGYGETSKPEKKAETTTETKTESKPTETKTEAAPAPKPEPAKPKKDSGD